MKTKLSCFSMALCVGFLALPAALNADVISLYTVAADIAGIDTIDHDPAGGVFTENITTSTIGTGDALRLGDYSITNKPEAWWDIASSITDGFRLHLDSENLNLDAGDQDINLRFGNTSSSRPTSSARTFTTVSYEQDGSLKIDGSTQADHGAGPLSVDFIANVSATESLNYTLFGMTRDLAPLQTDTWVDGVLEDADNPMSVGSAIVVAEGVNELGFTGSSNAAQNMDFAFDNIVLYTGTDFLNPAAVPEPSSLALLGLLGCAGFVRRRR